MLSLAIHLTSRMLKGWCTIDNFYVSGVWFVKHYVLIVCVTWRDFFHS